MAPVTSTNARELHASIEDGGFSFVQGADMRALLEARGPLSDWASFADSWDRLELDTYMADGGRYRKRRHAVFAAAPGGAVERQPHQPHYQTLDYNPLNGGVARWFEPVDDTIGAGDSLTTVLRFCRDLFESLDHALPRWHIEVHQFRIEARTGQTGRPTPEGVHRDGVDFVLVLLVNRRNIASGVTTIHALDGTPLGQFTLTAPFDAALVDDTRVAHGVTPVEPLDSTQPAYRDVLVVTFRKA